MSGRTRGSGRKRGSRNKRTLQREAAIREAEQQALVGLKSTDDVQLANSKVVLNEAMKYFFGCARATKDPVERGDHYIAASAIAEKLIGFEFPKLSSPRSGLARTARILSRCVRVLRARNYARNCLTCLCAACGLAMVHCPSLW